MDLSERDLKKLAFDEYARQGGRLAWNYEATVKRAACDWDVFVHFIPTTAGGHFTVVIDGVTGKVKKYVPGL